MSNTYRITAILNVGTDIIANIAASSVGQAGIFVIMSVETFRTDVILFICDLIMCFMSDWPINLHIFVDQGQFSDPDFINSTHQRENVQFADKYKITASMTVKTDIIIYQ